jgi:hypothetical protein
MSSLGTSKRRHRIFLLTATPYEKKLRRQLQESRLTIFLHKMNGSLDSKIAMA